MNFLPFTFLGLLLAVFSFLRLVLGLPLSGLVPTCGVDGLWKQTLVGTVAFRRNDTVCSNLTSPTIFVTRLCGLGPKWNDPICNTQDNTLIQSTISTLTQILVSPDEGLNSLSELLAFTTSNISLAEAILLLSAVSKDKVNIQQFFGTALNFSFLVQLESDLDTRRSLSAQLLLAMDEFALNQVQPPNLTLNINNKIFLRVLEFNDTENTDVTGIEVGNNFIVLPREILSEGTAEPVRIASFLHQNLSNLLPPKHPRDTIISPIISSVCRNCLTDLLHQNVTIKLQITDVLQTTSIISCVLFQFELSEDNQTTGDWSTEGCTTKVNGDFVTCSCNRLSHFAIRVSIIEEFINPHDNSTTEFDRILRQIQKSPVEGLNLLSGLISSTTSNISLSQSVLLLNALSQEAVNVPSTPKFVQQFFGIALNLSSLIQLDTDLDTTVSSGTQLLQTLNEFALTLVERPSNVQLPFTPKFIQQIFSVALNFSSLVNQLNTDTDIERSLGIQLLRASDQFIFTLVEPFNAQLSLTSDFVQQFFGIALNLSSLIQLNTDLDNVTSSGTKLLQILNEFALTLVEPSNVQLPFTPEFIQQIFSIALNFSSLVNQLNTDTDIERSLVIQLLRASDQFILTLVEPFNAQLSLTSDFVQQFFGIALNLSSLIQLDADSDIVSSGAPLLHILNQFGLALTEPSNLLLLFTSEFVQPFFGIVTDLSSLIVQPEVNLSTRRLLGSQLLYTTDEFILTLIEPSNKLLSFTSELLRQFFGTVLNLLSLVIKLVTDLGIGSRLLGADLLPNLVEFVSTLVEPSNINALLPSTSDFVQQFLGSVLHLSSLIQMEPDPDIRRSLGAQLLVLLDEFALTQVEPSDTTVNTKNKIFLRVLEFNNKVTMNITGIKVGRNVITLPPEILGEEILEPVRIASFLYKNLSYLLPPRDSNTTIISPIISSITNCRECQTDQLNQNVTIQLQITDPPRSQSAANISCAFFQFEFLEDNQTTGKWSTEGCFSAVNGDIVTCSCNHLTHFAILLSPGGEEISGSNVRVLNMIGIVMVPISLLCMVIVILTYSMMRSLWNMRNYIHIMLCVSLFMAQLVFVIGIDKTENERVCSAIAVLLQYLFLVTFMWMLMEGVVLYVTLIKVFVKNPKCYIIGFTITSYGIPAIYMAIVVPIGFLVGVDNIPGHTHYLYYFDSGILFACWLNYTTYFLWSFIAPVVIIILANIFFFFMAIVVMTKHRKKAEKHSSTATAKYWLRTSITLTLVMGITWLVGVLVLRELVTVVAYISTILIAAQGAAILIVLVPLSKQVRMAYLELCRKWTYGSFLFSKLFSFKTNSIPPPHGSTQSSNHAQKVGGIKLGTFENFELSSEKTQQHQT